MSIFVDHYVHTQQILVWSCQKKCCIYCEYYFVISVTLLYFYFYLWVVVVRFSVCILWFLLSLFFFPLSAILSVEKQTSMLSCSFFLFSPSSLTYSIPPFSLDSLSYLSSSIFLFPFHFHLCFHNILKKNPQQFLKDSFLHPVNGWYLW